MDIEHLKTMVEILIQLKAVRVYQKYLFELSVENLGNVISENGIQPTNKKAEAF